MVEVGGYPLLWHIMKQYSSFGFDEFVVCLGYKGSIIKSYFADYHLSHGSLTVDLTTGQVDKHDVGSGDAWKVHLLETGTATMTGGRIKRAAQFLNGRPFMATYGDGVSNIDIAKLLAFHKGEGRAATLSAVRPPARFGGVVVEGSGVSRFTEKPQIGEGWINGGFMVFEPSIVDLIESDETILERSPLETLSATGQLSAYTHDGFWQCMDTVRDLTILRELWDSGKAPWKTWQ
jgi:glucose-1-phosphate cytidylyltransferase